jgi:hypothetical protein
MMQVQHRGLRETSRGDVAAMTFVINVVADLFPEFSYRWWVGTEGRGHAEKRVCNGLVPLIGGKCCFPLCGFAGWPLLDKNRSGGW